VELLQKCFFPSEERAGKVNISFKSVDFGKYRILLEENYQVLI
jgi:hypothetical protein